MNGEGDFGANGPISSLDIGDEVIAANEIARA